MRTVLLLYALGALALTGALVLLQKKAVLPGIICTILSFAGPVAAAWLGADFSPSFTMIFLGINLSLYAASMLLAEFSPKHRFGNAIQQLLFTVGTSFAFPSVYIYTAGDDFQQLSLIAALIAGSVLSLGVILLQHRKGTASLGSGAVLWIHAVAAAFTLFGGFSSVGLLPYGLGLWLVWIGQQLPRQPWRLALCWVGLAAAALFAVLPAVC